MTMNVLYFPIPEDNFTYNEITSDYVADIRETLKKLDTFCGDWITTGGCNCKNCPLTNICKYKETCDKFVDLFNENNPFNNVNT